MNYNKKPYYDTYKKDIYKKPYKKSSKKQPITLDLTSIVPQININSWLGISGDFYIWPPEKTELEKIKEANELIDKNLENYHPVGINDIDKKSIDLLRNKIDKQNTDIVTLRKQIVNLQQLLVKGKEYLVWSRIDTLPEKKLVEILYEDDSGLNVKLGCKIRHICFGKDNQEIKNAKFWRNIPLPREK